MAVFAPIPLAWTSFTPTVTAASGSITSYTVAASYVQIGKTVHFHANITITNNGTGAGNVTMTLPVTALNTSTVNCYGRADGVSGKSLQGINATTTQLAIFNYDNSYPGSTNEILKLSATYEAA